MCLDCARRRLRQLRHTYPFSEGDGWFMCIVDHDDHIHVRINAQEGEGEGEAAAAPWVQIPAPLDVFQVALRETSTSTAYTSTKRSWKRGDAATRWSNQYRTWYLTRKWPL